MIFLAISLFLVFICTATIAPTFFDAGEFVAVVESLGNSHPTGHPTYALFVKPFLWLPLGNKAFRVSLASSAYMALFFTFFAAMTRNLFKQVPLLRSKSFLFAIALTVVVAFHPSIVLQWSRPEVYPLFYALLLGAALLLDPTLQDQRKIYSGIFLLGLAVATQPLLGGLFLFLLILFQIPQKRFWNLEWIFLLLGLAVFLYIPLRATQNPIINWDNPASFGQLLKVLLAKDFQVFFHTPGSAQSLRDFSKGNLLNLLSPFSLLLAIMGVFFSFRKLSGRQFAFLLCLLLGALLPFFVKDFYLANPDSHAYMVPFLCFALLLSVLGACLFIEHLPHKAFSLLLLLPLLLFLSPKEAFSVWKQDPSTRSDILAQHLKYLPPGANLSLHSDHWIFPIWNAQYCEGRRPDVSISNKGMLRASWYQTQLRQTYGDLLRRTEIHETGRITNPSFFTGYLLSDTSRASSLRNLFRKSCQEVREHDPFGTQMAICTYVETIPLSYLRGEGRFKELAQEAASFLKIDLSENFQCQTNQQALTLPYPLSLEFRDRYFIGSPHGVESILASTLFLCSDWLDLERQALSKTAPMLDAKLLWAWHLWMTEKRLKAIKFLNRPSRLNPLENALQDLALSTFYALEGQEDQARVHLNAAKKTLGDHPAVTRLNTEIESRRSK